MTEAAEDIDVSALEEIERIAVELAPEGWVQRWTELLHLHNGSKLSAKYCAATSHLLA